MKKKPPPRGLFPAALLGSLALFLAASCVTMRESPYDGLEYEELLKKRGLPSYSINQTVDADTPRSEYDPDFFRHFSAGELEASVMVKYAAWIKTHSALMVWLKQAGESWIVFDSVEYRGPFLR